MAPVVDELGGAVHSAMETRRRSLEFENMRAQNRLLKAQEGNVNAQAALSRAALPVPQAIADAVTGIRGFFGANLGFSPGAAAQSFLNSARSATTNALEAGAGVLGSARSRGRELAQWIGSMLDRVGSSAVSKKRDEPYRIEIRRAGGGGR